MIKLTADKVKVTGPKVDGGYTVSFDVGEYEQANVARIIIIPQGQAIEITVKD